MDYELGHQSVYTRSIQSTNQSTMSVSIQHQYDYLTDDRYLLSSNFEVALQLSKNLNTI